MLEGLLERVLQRTLGKYIDQLDKQSLSVSIWNGDVSLENLSFKKSVFQELKLPMNLLLGKIGKLRMKIPWNKLSSQPCELSLESVNIVVNLKGKDEWDVVAETMHTQLSLKEAFLDKLLQEIYMDLQKQKVDQEEHGSIIKNLLTKTVDNLQISIKNLHFRLESNNVAFSKELFSMGFTLQQLKLRTTDPAWNYTFIDRTTTDHDKNKPLYKVLEIKNFGFYYKPNDYIFINELQTDAEKLHELAKLFPLNQAKIQNYKDDYLIEPMELLTKLKIDPSNYNMQISLDITKLEIQMRKKQLQNIAKLMELDYEYNSIQDAYQLQIRNQFAKDLSERYTTTEYIIQRYQQIVQQRAQCWTSLDKPVPTEKILSSETFEEYGAIVMGSQIEELKEWARPIIQEQVKMLQQEQVKSLKSKKAKAVASQSGWGSYIGSMIYGSEVNESEEIRKEQALAINLIENQLLVQEQESPLDSYSSEKNQESEFNNEEEFFDAVEDLSQILPIELDQKSQSLQLNLKESLDNRFQKHISEDFLVKRRQTPAELLHLIGDVKGTHKPTPIARGEFRLGSFVLSLINNNKDKSGIQIFTKEFTVKLKKYDERPENPLNYQLFAKTEDFGIVSIKKFTTPLSIIEKIEVATAVEEVKKDGGEKIRNKLIVSELRITKSNAQYGQLTANTYKKQNKPNIEFSTQKKSSAEEEVDLEIVAILRPIKIVYRPDQIFKLSEFFTLENLNDDVRQRAQKQLAQLRNQVATYQKTVLVESKKKNNLKIEIKCPVVELPFSNNLSSQQINDKNDKTNERWSIDIGDLQISNMQNCGNLKSQHLLTSQLYKNFTLKIKQGRFKYLGYNQQKNLVEDFTLTVHIDVKQAQDQKTIGQPNLKISGELDKISIHLTPYLYNNIVNISKLISETSHQSQKSLNSESFDVLQDQAVLQGQLQLQGTTIKYFTPYYSILTAKQIYFFSEDKTSTHKEVEQTASDKFSLLECVCEVSKSSDCQLEISNPDSQRVLLFDSIEETTKWKTAIQLQSKSKQEQLNITDKIKSDKLEFQDYSSDEKIDYQFVQSSILFKIPQINVFFTANKNQLRSELGDDDPYDVGIFSFKDSPIDSFKLLLIINQLTITQKKKKLEYEVDVIFGNVKLHERLQDETKIFLRDNSRFPYLLNCEQGLKIQVKSIDRKSPDYHDNDMSVDLDLSELDLNWKPRSFNRFLRFVRYLKFKEDAYQQQLQGMKFRHKQMIIHEQQQIDKNFKKRPTLLKAFSLANESTVMDCSTNKEILMSVNAIFRQLNIVCIHPNNDTYPLFTICLQKKQLKFLSKFDHDEISIRMGNLEIVDNTNYPKTLDPTKIFKSTDPLHTNIIMSRKKSADKDDGYMMEMKMIIFHYPLERTCHIARQDEFKTYDKHVKIDLKSINMIFLMEYMFRIQDYFFCQLIGAASDSNPYYQLGIKAKDAFQSWIDSQQEIPKLRTSAGTKNELNQYKLCTGLDICISHPVIILKDRHYLKRGKIRIDFGDIKISNETNKVQGRWKSKPNKEVLTTTTKISGHGFTMSYTKPTTMRTDFFTILPATNFAIGIEKLNHSEIIEQVQMSIGFDFEDFDISQHIKIKFSSFRLQMTQEVYTYFLRCNDLNINYSDQFVKYFQLAIWNDPNTMKWLKLEADQVEKYAGNTKVFQRKMLVKFPSFSFSLRNNDSEFSLIAELVFWNYQIEINKFLDRRNDIHLKAHSLQILRLANQKFELKRNLLNPNQDLQNCKALIMGHTSAHNYLVTDQDYYNFNIDRIVQATKASSITQERKRRAMLEKSNFEVTITLMPTSEKIIKCKLTQPKMFMRTDIFLMISEFFNTAHPKYDKESFEKPNFYSSDPNIASRQEIMLEMEEGLICLENEEDSSQTLVCFCSLILNKTRETMNTIKLNLLDRFSKLQESSNQNVRDEDFDYSAKTGLMLMSMTQFSPYFCQTIDLDGKPFSQVKKRELMSPFNMHYNVYEMLELKQKTEILTGHVRNLIFRSYKKTDASIDWTLFKITFQDILTMQQILDHTSELVNENFKEWQMNRLQSYDSLSEDSDYSQSSNQSQKNFNRNFGADISKISEKSSQGEKSGSSIDSDSSQNPYQSQSDSEQSNSNSEESKKPTQRNFSPQKLKVKVNMTPIPNSNSPNTANKLLRRTTIFDTLKVIQSAAIQRNEEKVQQPSQFRRDGLFNNQIDNPFYFKVIEQVQKLNSLEKLDDQQFLVTEKSDSDQSQSNVSADSFDVKISEVGDEGEQTYLERNLRTKTQKVHTFSQVKTLTQHSESASSQSNNVSLNNTANDEHETTQKEDLIQLRVIPREEISKFTDKELINVIYQEAGHDCIQIVSYGVHLLLINDNKDNFLPVLGVQLSEFLYSFGLKNSVQVGKTQLSLQFSYYNALAGSWEPALEMCNLSLSYQIQKNANKEISVRVDKETNFNLSESLLKTVNDTTKSIKQAESRLDRDNFFKRDQTILQSRGLIQGNLIDFSELEGDLAGKKGNQSTEIIVTPYAICNLTEAEILIEKEVTAEQFQKVLIKKEKMEKQRRQTGQANVSDASNKLSTQNITLLRQQKSYLPNISQLDSSKNSSENQESFRVAVLKVPSCVTQNYAVDFEKQIKQQIDQYRHINLKSEEIITVSFGRKSKVPIHGVNLNKSGLANRHYFPNSKFKEFLLYAVSFKNLKRVLTIRTQFLIHNQTLENYKVRVISLFDKTQFQEKNFNSGDLLPIPESYNQSILQLKIASEDDFGWSDEWHIYALKNIVKPNCPGHLRHGKTYTFFRKVETEDKQVFNINLMPPLVLKNCLPCLLFVQFVDSNNALCKIQLEKEEVRNIFQFDLQQEIKLQVSIPAYNSAILRLDNTVELLEEQRDQITLQDFEGHRLQIYYTKCSKTAGFTLNFYVQNCIINQTNQNLQLFYDTPSREFDLTLLDQQQLVSVPFEISNNISNTKDQQELDKLYLLSPTRGVWAKLESSAEVSSEINTFAPGTNEKFQLVRKNRLYEYGYSTEIYLANKSEFIYTKITTISPLYIVVNYTKSTVLFAQTQAKNSPIFVKPNQHLPFHWSDKQSEKLVSVRVIPCKNDKDHSEDFDWSCGIGLQECGSLIVHNRSITDRPQGFRTSITSSQLFSQNQQKRISNAQQSKSSSELKPLGKSKKRFLRINRKYHKHQMYIIIEEEDPDLPNMLIENLCNETSIVFQQIENKNQADIDIVEPNSFEAFSWTDQKNPKLVQVQFYQGKYSEDATMLHPLVDSNRQTSITISLDELNFNKQEVIFTNDSIDQIKRERIFFSVTTNGYTKILRFDNKPLVRVYEESSLISNSQSTVGPITKYDVFIPQINFSLLNKKCELLTVYFIGTQVNIETTSSRTKFDFKLQKFQIDNQSDRDPIYPVMLKSKREVIKNAQNQFEFAQEQDVFQLSLDIRKDVENVIYFDLVQFLLQHLELKLELSHLVLLADFGTRVGKMFKRNLNVQHKIFQSITQDQLVHTRRNINLLEEQKIQQREQDYLDRQRLVVKNRRASIANIKLQSQKTLVSTSKQSQYKKTEDIKSKTKLDRVTSKEKKRRISVNQEGQTEAAQHSDVKRVYIKEYIGSPLKITISLIKHGVSLDDGSNELTLFKTISSLGLSISTFENAPITLNALKIKNIFGDQDDVTEQLKGYYLQTIKWNTLSFLGASNLIGNPISFINTLGTGVEEFFYEPYQGFMRGGAAEGGLGIFRGTGSLVKNTFVGSVSSFGKISSSLSAGILSITGDEEFIQRRNMGMIRQKPRGVMQGLEQGLNSALRSGWSGLRDIVDKPSLGYTKFGASGFFQGALQGAAGLFVKPMSGAMDLMVKTSEGIENSQKSHLEFLPDERLRQPRAFYEIEKVIRDYDIVHANVLSIAPKLKFYAPDSDRNGQLFQSIDIDIFYGAWILEETNDGYWDILMLTSDQIVRIKRFQSLEMLEEEQKSNERLRKQGKQLIQIVSMYKISELKQIELYERMLDLDFEDGREIIEIIEERVADSICSKIKQLYQENLKTKSIAKIQYQQSFTISQAESLQKLSSSRSSTIQRR